MSVLIKGMDMPENCRQCDFTHCTHFGQKLCTLLTEAISIKHKLPNCPLVEIPTPHGRMIDADEPLKTIEANDYMLRSELNTFDRGMFTIGIQQAINEAPTIIEAEGKS